MATQEILLSDMVSVSQLPSVFLRSFQVSNLLSFGPDTPELPLGSLNVLIGPNGSGKSNLIEAISLLRSTPNNIQDVVRKGGGIREWIWKGNPAKPATLEIVTADYANRPVIRHFFQFMALDYYAYITDERIERMYYEEGIEKLELYYSFSFSPPSVFLMGTRELENFDVSSSILAQRRDPEHYREITSLAEQYNRIRIYREWAFGRNTVFREPQRADMRTDRLEEDFSNLGLFLNKLRRNPQAKNKILTHLRDIYDGVDDFDVSIEGGTVQVFFTEGNFTIPATRLSDGTLRYLCLLAILCDPTPPPLICIEEPELGLHPDILPKIADLLVEASERTQLIVTTHSEILVDAMTEHPESVVVCEKHNGQTEMRRLSADDLSVWLEKYQLGQLWMRGDLGGTRW